MTTETTARHPRILDPVLVWGERGSIVLLRAGYAHIERDDDVRVQVGVDRLRWDPLGSVWLIVTEDEA